MKTKMECLQRAVICERMSEDTDEEANRLALVATAAQWRALAHHAPADKATIARDRVQAEGNMAGAEPAPPGTPCNLSPSRGHRAGATRS